MGFRPLPRPVTQHSRYESPLSPLTKEWKKSGQAPIQGLPPSFSKGDPGVLVVPAIQHKHTRKPESLSSNPEFLAWTQKLPPTPLNGLTHNKLGWLINHRTGAPFLTSPAGSICNRMPTGTKVLHNADKGASGRLPMRRVPTRESVLGGSKYFPPEYLPVNRTDAKQERTIESLSSRTATNTSTNPAPGENSGP